MCFCFKGNIACNITKKTMIYDTLKTYFYPDPALFFLIFKHYFILNKIKCLNFYACLCHVLFKKWNFFEKSWRHSVPGKFIMFLLFKVSKSWTSVRACFLAILFSIFTFCCLLQICISHCTRLFYWKYNVVLKKVLHNPEVTRFLTAFHSL